ncbi:ATP-binding protein [Chromohalobacter salexigens]|nr:ATP-binding protein [Chromohalobacter salexigens]
MNLPEGLDSSHDKLVSLALGKITGGTSSPVKVTPEKLFGRHCAVLGSTGGGKSWTVAKIIEECAKFKGAKIIIIDATGEFRSLDESYTRHYHLNTPVLKNPNSIEIAIPPTDFVESDFMAMFNPAGRVQGPKLREAMKSLRLANLAPDLFPSGIVEKIQNSKENYRKAMNRGRNSSLVDNPSQEFDVSKLVKQLVQECCWDEGDRWGKASPDLGYCSSLFTRIQSVIYSSSLRSVFNNASLEKFGSILEDFLRSSDNVLRICLSDVRYEFNAREILANVIGRRLLESARFENFRHQPILAVLDEAHNFLGRKIGEDEEFARLDAFELIAKEGRKYGLHICLATQRPRDITEGVLSQMGTLLVHRLTNDNDRQVVERACGEIDRSAASFLPNLKQGELALVGVDFPIPMTIQVQPPASPPMSDSPDFQDLWTR